MWWRNKREQGDSCPGCLPKGRAQIQFRKRDDCFIAKMRKKVIIRHETFIVTL